MSAAAFAGIGSHLSTNYSGTFAGGLNATGYGLKIAAHGMAGGVMSVLQGGKFGHGFTAAGFTAAGTAFNNSNHIGGKGFSHTRVAIGAVIGGTASKLSGGKFSNGAVTGAFSQAFNNESSEQRKLDAQKGNEKGRALTANEIEAAKKVYGDTIDYSEVRIISGKYFFLQGKNTMMAPNGNVYDPRGGECADYTTCQVISSSGARLDSHGTFIHEMGHIAQHQAGVNVFWGGLGQQLLYRVSFGLYNPYSVTLGSPPPIANIEAFAEYNRRNYCSDTGACNGW